MTSEHDGLKAALRVAATGKDSIDVVLVFPAVCVAIAPPARSGSGSLRARLPHRRD